MELKERELVDRQKVPFVGMTRNLGRAEFVVCPVFKYGKLREFYMYPAQQENVEFYYVARNKNGWRDFGVNSWSGVDAPKIWLHSWCKEHKCQSFRLYVPNDAEWFQASFLSSFGIYFGKG